MEAADQLIRQGGGPASQRLFSALLATHRIYRLNLEGSADSNLARARLLKTSLAGRLASRSATVGPGKILLEFGEWHLYRGYNPLGERDLGNYLAEYADLEGAPSLHIAVLGARGVHANYAGYGRPLGHTPFVMSDDDDYHWLRAAMDVALPSGWTVFDLTRLRGHAAGDLPPDWRRLADGYDILVLAPMITPAGLIAP